MTHAPSDVTAFLKAAASSISVRIICRKEELGSPICYCLCLLIKLVMSKTTWSRSKKLMNILNTFNMLCILLTLKSLHTGEKPWNCTTNLCQYQHQVHDQLSKIWIYYINTSEIPSELSRENFISSHVKVTCYLHMWRDHRRYSYIINRAFESGAFALVFHWCLYNKQNITCPLIDMNFIFSWSTRYLTPSLRSLVRYWVDHSKIKFISTRGHVISSITLMIANCPPLLLCDIA